MILAGVPATTALGGTFSVTTAPAATTAPAPIRTPCDILKVPHHASLSSTTRKLLRLLQPKAAVVCVAAGRPDERPHPYIVSLLKEFTEDVHFTDAVEIPGLVEPVFHTSVHIELP